MFVYVCCMFGLPFFFFSFFEGLYMRRVLKCEFDYDLSLIVLR